MLKRAILLLGGPLAALVVTVATAALLAGELPDPIATHWNGGGEPDGHAPLWAFVLPLAGVQLAAWGALLWQARVRHGGGLRLTVAPYAWAAIAFLTAIALIVVAANDGAADWRAAGEVGPLSVLAALAAGALGAVAGWALERGRPVAEVGATGAADGVEAVALEPGQRVVWSRGLVSRPAIAGTVVLGAAFVVAGIVAGGAGGWALAAGGVVAALAASALTEIVATVDARGLTIAFGPLGWPRQTVALEQIARAEATTIDPLRVGGWGYRKVPRRPGVSAVVLRGGEGIRVVRADGSELLVTIPDAARGAALLEALRARAAA